MLPRTVSPDLIGRAFEAEEPNQKWVSDITYIPVGNDYAYLAVVMDLFSRKIVGWSFRSTMTTQLILGAVRKACENRCPTAPLIFHSDRGSQYTSENFRNELAENGMKSSMGHTGDCFDNAVAESFFSTLKRERVNREPGDTSTYCIAGDGKCGDPEIFKRLFQMNYSGCITTEPHLLHAEQFHVSGRENYIEAANRIVQLVEEAEFAVRKS